MKLPRKNALEWTVFAISLVVVLGALGYLTYAAITDTNQPAILVVELGEVEVQEAAADSAAAESAQQPPLYNIPVTVHNLGEKTAEEVLVEVTLEVDGEEVETAELTIPLVPYQSTRAGMVAFKQDPREGQLTAKVVGYLE